MATKYMSLKTWTLDYYQKNRCIHLTYSVPGNMPNKLRQITIAGSYVSMLLTFWSNCQCCLHAPNFECRQTSKRVKIHLEIRIIFFSFIAQKKGPTMMTMTMMWAQAKASRAYYNLTTSQQNYYKHNAIKQFILWLEMILFGEETLTSINSHQAGSRNIHCAWCPLLSETYLF